jgi:sigma-54 dependent transcriptional regulator, acetoin dehydrogenase operon transcriptional activator AcoR
VKTLIVEDDSGMRSLFELLLRRLGHEVTGCSDAELAWETYRQGGYQLIILDWLLPGMDGLELCRRMRSLPYGDTTFILMITARNRPEDLQKALEAGADDYLTKPLDVDLLKVRLTIVEQQVQNLIERKRAEAKLGEIFAQIEKSRDDMLSILNQLCLGTAITDENGYLTFLSMAAQYIFEKSREDTLGVHWVELFPIQDEEKAQLKIMSERPFKLRTKVPVHIETTSGRHYWADIEIHDDPRNPQRKIFFIYDTTEIHDLRRLLDERAQFHDLIGKSESMRLIYKQIQELSKVDSTVLIEGDTGTGKELVARAIHFTSHRKGKPFIAMNCAGLTDSLLGSQLFGHKRGAFTGAVEDHQGLFEAANGGTLFLDEIGDIPMNVQTSLLRVLQEKEITRLGESKPRKIDVRVLAATHRNLNQEVKEGRFRQDLLYRIRVIRINLPALRERREDIPLLVSLFLSQCRAATGKPVLEVGNEAMRKMMEYNWPGNVRELKNAMEFALIHCRGSVIQVEDLPPELTDTGYFNNSPSIPAVKYQDEKEQLQAALIAARGNRTSAARILGISRATLYRRMAELGVEK